MATFCTCFRTFPAPVTFRNWNSLFYIEAQSLYIGAFGYFRPI